MTTYTPSLRGQSQPVIRRLLRFYNAHVLHADLITALAGASVLAVVLEAVVGRVAVNDFLRGNRQVLYATGAQIFGAMLGFVITTVSIVLLFTENPALRIVRESGHFTTLFNVFLSAIRWLGLATALALITVVLDRDSRPCIALTYLMLAVSLVAVARLARSVWVLQKVIHSVISRAQP